MILIRKRIIRNKNGNKNKFINNPVDLGERYMPKIKNKNETLKKDLFGIPPISGIKNRI